MLGWTYYKTITLDSVQAVTGAAEDLDEFPALVACDADAELASARADGGDLRFTLADGRTELGHWIESWSGGGGSAGTLRAWVRIPRIAATAGATIRLYWGNPSAASASNPAAPWDDDFLLVCPGHDGTTNAKMANLVGNVAINKKGADEPGQAAGIVATAQQYDIDDYALTADTTTIQPAAWTAEAWVKYAGAPSGTTQPLGGWYAQQVAALHWSSTGRPFLYRGATNYRCWQTATWNTIKNGSWHHVAFSIPGDAKSDIALAQLFVDGVAQAAYLTLSTGTVAAKSGQNYYLGSGMYASALRSCEALLSHFRLSQVVRSAAWLQYTHQNLAAAGWRQTWGPAIRLGVVLGAAARQCFVAGSATAAVFASGAVTGESFVAGSRAGQAHE